MPLTKNARVCLSDIAIADDVHRTGDGYLACEARVARVGTQKYRGREVGMADRDHVILYRPADEVFNREAMHSMAFKPVTLTHPGKMVDARSWGRVAKGFSSGDVVRDGEYVRVPLMLADAEAIDAFESGVRELSVGYTTDIDWSPGVTPEGEAYDGVQRSIRANHHALVPVARGGRNLRFGDGRDGFAVDDRGWSDEARQAALEARRARQRGDAQMEEFWRVRHKALGGRAQQLERAAAVRAGKGGPGTGGQLANTPEQEAENMRNEWADASSDCPKCGYAMDHGKCPNCGYTKDADMDDAWSDEARAAALAARQRGGAGDEEEERRRRARAAASSAGSLRMQRGVAPQSSYSGDADLDDEFPESEFYDRDVSEEERKGLAKQGKALPGGGFPIKNKADLANAKQAFGRAKNKAATRALINRRARELGEPGLGDGDDAAYDGEEGEAMITMMVDGLPVQVADNASADILKAHLAKADARPTRLRDRVVHGPGSDDDGDADDNIDGGGKGDGVAAEQEREKKERGYKDAIAAKDGQIALLTKKLGDAQFTEAQQEEVLRARETVKDSARKVLGDSFDFGAKTLSEIKRATVAAVMGGDKALDGWEDARVQGAFDLAIAQGGPGNGGARAVSGAARMADGFSNGMRASERSFAGGRQMSDSDAAYEEYVKRLGSDYKTPMGERRN